MLCYKQLKKGGDKMSEREKQMAENLAKACELLPDDKKEFLLGYAEGVAAMAARQAAIMPPEKSQQSGRF